MKKIYINDSDLMEFLSEVTDKIVCAKFGDSAIIPDGENCTRYSEEAQDFFNETYDNIESMADSYIGVISDIRKDEIEEGDAVTINIPFTYKIGDVGYYSNKTLNTIEDCKDEVLSEIENGFPYGEDICLTV